MPLRHTYFTPGIVAALLCSLCSVPSVRGQERLTSTASNSPLQTEFENRSLRPGTDMRDAYLRNPALIHRMVGERRYFSAENPGFVREKPGTIFIAADGASGRQEGDYLPYEGQEFRDFSVRADGYKQGDRATFFARIGFTAGGNDNVGWSALRNPGLYWPYIVADSTGGDFRYEKYDLMCGYSFRLGRFDLGMSGEYTGDFAFRQNDPRIEDISTWLTFKAGAAYAFRRHVIALNAEFMHHRQHADVKHFRTGQFAGFFIEYGFGMFDYIFSPIFNSMEQRQHINAYGVNLTFNSDPSRALRLNLLLGYGRETMKTEENNYKVNLYRAPANTFDADLGILWNDRRWGAEFLVKAAYEDKKGTENIFERYISSSQDGVDVYDFRKIGEQNRYGMKRLDGSAELKVSRFLGRHYTVSLLGGVGYMMREETYKDHDYLIRNVLLTPSLGIGARYSGEKFDVELRGCWSHRTVPESRYEVGVDLEKNTEFQHAFTTYAYYANTAELYTAELTVARHFRFGTFGLRGQMLCGRGNRIRSFPLRAGRTIDVAAYDQPDAGPARLGLVPGVAVHRFLTENNQIQFIHINTEEMEIKVLGGGCSSCSQMYDNARIAVDELGLDLEVEFIHDITKALQYEVLQMPALIIDEKAVSFGRDLSVDEIKEILKKYR